MPIFIMSSLVKMEGKLGKARIESYIKESLLEGKFTRRNVGKMGKTGLLKENVRKIVPVLPHGRVVIAQDLEQSQVDFVKLTGVEMFILFEDA